LYGVDLVSVAVFGSWARGTATPVSDVDVLIIAGVLPSSRRRRVEQFERVEIETEDERRRMWDGDGPPPELSPVIKTPDEVSAGAPLFLDMTEWCEIIYDRDAFLDTFLGCLRKRLKRNGARRVWAKGGYYWEYKPDSVAAEVIEL